MQGQWILSLNEVNECRHPFLHATLIYDVATPSQVCFGQFAIFDRFMNNSSLKDLLSPG